MGLYNSILISLLFQGCLLIMLPLSYTMTASAEIVTGPVLLQSKVQPEQQATSSRSNAENVDKTEQNISAAEEFPMAECYMDTPSGYRNIGGDDRIGPYSDRSSCESVNSQYFSGQGSCSCTDIIR